jgi:predicted HTH transcriptional regulator
MKDTSIKAYEGIQPHLGHMQAEVFRAISKNQGITRQGLVQVLDKPINCITGRVKELIDKGLIVELGKSNNQYRLYAIKLILTGEANVAFQ